LEFIVKKSLLIAALTAVATAASTAFLINRSRPNNDGVSNASEENLKGFSYNSEAFVHASPVQIM
jgi:hypothetical protein